MVGDLSWELSQNARKRAGFKTNSPIVLPFVRFFCSLNPHTVHGKGFAMGATTKSITGLFANFCGRVTRQQIVAGQGTRSAAAQGYLPLSTSAISLSWRDSRDSIANLDLFSGLKQAREEARWLLKRLGGQLSSALPSMSGILSPARCPASPSEANGSRPTALVSVQANGPRSQVVGRQETGVHRFQG